MIVCGAAAIALAGCVSVLPEPEAPDALYRIEGQKTIQGLTENVIIREPEAPRLSAGQAMVSEMSGRLRLIPRVEWAGAATRQMQNAIIDSFSLQNDGNALLPESGVSTAYEVFSHMKVFHVVDGEAVCDMTVATTFLISRNGASQVEHVSAKVPVRGDRADDLAFALKEAGEQCAEEAARFIADATDNNP
ncbi:MAG: ABC-type transport auxiliary lipoprotein family protein [Pseudomonadota bacterium]